MRIQTMNNSEIFDSYSSIMDRYLKKRANATSTLLKELPSFADEIAGMARPAAKVVIDTNDKLFKFWRDLFNTEWDQFYEFLFNANKIINDGTDPRLADPAFIRSIIEQLTLAKKQLSEASKFIEPPTTPDGTAFFQMMTKELPGELTEMTTEYTAKLGAAEEAMQRASQEAAAAAAARTTGEGATEALEEGGEKAVREGLEEGVEEGAGEAGERAAREGLEEAVPEAVDIAAEPAAKATAEIVQQVGEEAAPVVQQEVKVLVEGGESLGTAEGTKVALESMQRQITENADTMQRQVAEQMGAMSEKIDETIGVLKSELSEQIAKSTEKTAAAAAEGVAGNAGKIAKVEEGYTTLVQEVRQLAKDVAKAGGKDALPDTARGAASEGFRQWIKTSVAGGAIFKAVKIGGAVIIGAAMLGGGIYLVGQWLQSDEKRLAAYQAELSRLQQAIINATAAHKTLQFKDLTNGIEHNNDMLSELSDNEHSATTLMANSLSDPDNYDSIVAASEQLDELDSEAKEFLSVKDRIVGDLSDQAGWNEALAADQELVQALGRVNAALQRAIQGAGQSNASGGSSTGQDADRQGGQNGDPSASGPLGENEGRVILDVYGEQIDITGKPAGFRSAAPRMVRRLLSSPYGMAFVDPHDRWGGFIRKTGRPQVDYLNALGYLYKEGVFTPAQLRRFIRHAIPRQGRRRHSGWKNAVKYYRRHKVSHKSASNILINESLVKESTNRSDIGMRKMADQYPNQYISDAISGLSDQYAKSYYSGLKSQYNAKEAKPGADYKELYEVHKGKGSDLIQAAHPEAVVVSDSMGNGGLVENLLEQKSHSEGVAKSAPTGNFRGKHANLEVIEALNKLANQADKAGFFEVSDLIDSTITTILNK